MTAPPRRVAVQRGSLARSRAFRRVRSDRVWGLLGALLLAAALVLVFTWQKPVPPTPSVLIQWTEVETRLPPEDRQVATANPDPSMGGRDGTGWDNLTFLVVPANVTRVLVSANFTDDVGSSPAHGDRLLLTLRGPDGTNLKGQVEGVSNTSQGRNLTLTVPVNPMPSLSELPVGSVAEARAATRNLTRTFGSGEWEVELRLESHGWTWTGQDPQQPCNAGAQAAGLCTVDVGNRVRVAFQFWTFEPRFQAVAGRFDDVPATHLTIPGLERS